MLRLFKRCVSFVYVGIFPSTLKIEFIFGFSMAELKLDLELDQLFEEIERECHKKILIQLPDGLKPKAFKIQEKLLAKFPDLKITFWAGDCYGACDTPQASGFDLFVAFGHSNWKF